MLSNKKKEIWENILVGFLKHFQKEKLFGEPCTIDNKLNAIAYAFNKNLHQLPLYTIEILSDNLFL